jgi:signal transduction histidine kinase
VKTRAVLFVDDERQTLNSLKRLLRAEPYQLFLAESGHEALGIVERETIHVIVTDLGMPRMGGLELLNQVQERYPDIIRLVLSVHGDRNSILDAINSGNVYRYIIKPWDNIEIKLTVRQAIDQFNLQQERRGLLRRLEEHNRLLEKRVEARTKQLMAIEKQAEIGKHASHIVHNLNNPLQIIQGGVDLARLALSHKDPDLKKVAAYLQAIESSTSELEKIVAGIMIHARDRTLLKTEQIDINEIIKRELEFFKLDPAYKHQIKKKVVLSDGLPRIQGNPIHIKQIVDNLLKNAVDAMEHSAEKRLSIETSLENKTVLIRISDTGEGIEEENLERIFSPNFTTKPIGKGTGLGLASVKAMVDAYSGDIRVRSKKGKETTFLVRIPVK